VREINAAIGGTGSDLGVYRLEHDVLRHKPDLMFVEFSVNDGGASPVQVWRAMEGIVRQTWASNPRCDICFVYTFRVGYEEALRQGQCPRAASADEMLAQHYSVPSINMALRIVELEKAGKLVFKGEREHPPADGKLLFSTDGVHPLDGGHAIYTQVIGDAIEGWRASSKPVDHGALLAQPFVADHWQDAHMEPINPAMLEGDWQKLDPDTGLGKQFGDRLGVIWMAEHPGQKLHFRFRGSAVKLYDLLGPDGGQAIITVDGKTRPKPVPRFDSYCTYHRLATLPIAEGLAADAVHDVVVEVHPDQPDRTPVAFRLKDPAVELKSAKYQGTRLWVGAILLRGELVK
jgi:lysophospholipase L1-like esterase